MHVNVHAIGLLRAPIVVCFIAGAVLLLAGQSGEVVQAIWQARKAGFAFELGRALLGCGLMSIAILGSCMFLLHNATPHRGVEVETHRRLIARLALVLPLAPFVMFALASIRVTAPAGLSQVAEGFEWTRHKSFVAYLLVLLFVFILLLPFERLPARVAARARRSAKMPDGATAAKELALLAGVLAAIIATAALQPYRLSQVLGPVFVLMLFFGLVCVLTSLLTYVYDRHQIPAITLLLLAAVVWASLGWNHNRQIRFIEQAQPQTPPKVADAFAQWLGNRTDLADYKGRASPV